MTATVSARNTTLPPGPTGPAPLLGIRFLTARHELLPKWRERYGNLYIVRIGRDHNVVVLCTAELVREAFHGDPTVFHAGEGNRIVAPIMGPNSVLSLDEDEHLRIRRQLVPMFNGAALRGYRTLMTEVAEQFAGRWPVGRALPATMLMSALSMEVIVRVVYGIQDDERRAELRTLLRGLMPGSPLEFLGWAKPKLQRYQPWRRGVERLHAVDELLYAEIAARRAAPDLADRADLLSRLLAGDPLITDREVRDHLVTLLTAGFGTTSVAMAWALYELARHPEIQRKARAAAADGDDDYLVAVVKEAMRLHPVLFTVPRRLAKPVELGGYLLPAGTELAAGLGLVLLDGDNHPQPDRFRPDRFADAAPETGTWVPFGSGVRRCLGAAFAQQEATVVLRALLTRHNIGAVGEPEAPKLRGVVLAPGRGGQIVLSPRS